MDIRQVLPTGTLLDGSYRIRRVVGSGGFGITYEADDIRLATVVAIKEYYPFDFGERSATMTVRPKSDRHKHTFDWGRSNFIKEAGGPFAAVWRCETLASPEHPGTENKGQARYDARLIRPSRREGKGGSTA